MAVANSGTKGRFERCELWSNAEGGAYVLDEGDPTLVTCILRDHAKFGVHIDFDARGKATLEADCIFARNSKGDVRRMAQE